MNSMQEVEPLEEWIGKNAFGLGCEIATHLKVFGVEGDDCESLLRLIFTSVRQWSEGKIEEGKEGKRLILHNYSQTMYKYEDFFTFEQD